jgi:hypothetical protein
VWARSDGPGWRTWAAGGRLKGLATGVEKISVTGQAVRSVAGVVLTATLLGATIVGLRVLTRPESCCQGPRPYISLYNRPLPRVDAVLAEGDGQAFAAIGQDPLLRHPQVIGSRAEYAYRAQRPLWSYLAWLASLGQANLIGWALAVLTILSCGAASLLIATMLRQRGASPWWSILVPLIGLPVLTEFTPELAAAALLCAGILLWSREDRVLAVVALCLATLTRESMLVGVGALALWELRKVAGGRQALRRVAPLAWPFILYGIWIAIVTIRLGVSPFARSGGRLALPGAGLVANLGGGIHAETVLTAAGLAIVMGVAAIVLARRDVLTWMAVSYLAFAAILGHDVWATESGITRTLVPLYLLGSVAIIGGMRARRLQGVDPASTRIHAEDRHALDHLPAMS